MNIEQRPGPPFAGTLTYIDHEYSISFIHTEPDQYLNCTADGVASVAIGTLQIEVGLPRYEALHVWGYFPKISWKMAELPIPFSTPGVVQFVGSTFQRGIAYGVSDEDSWRKEFDPRSGWLRVAPEGASAERLTEIADGVLIGAADGRLSSIWMRPLFA
ncbi:hypothetical protein AB0K12_38675 [Nonomuraea sp. NPDC049419]|uniref:hypothetical protein n=1 Tax=Nonomuraea sp. NPDC049419 TaxID=3155772 RepID=UPI003421E803